MSENNHPINEVLQTTMNKIREMVDANTVVGQPIVTQDGVTLIPVSKLSFGFAALILERPRMCPKISAVARVPVSMLCLWPFWW